MDDDKLREALYKKAIGFSSNEIVEEYGLDENGNEVLNKKRITKKYNPPDISAVKLLLENQLNNTQDYSKMTLTELEEEKLRLLKILKEEEDEN